MLDGIKVAEKFTLINNSISESSNQMFMSDMWTYLKRTSSTCRLPQKAYIYMTGLRVQYFFYLVCEAIGTAATPGLLCQPRVIMKKIVEKQMECRLAEETEVL
jgi:hypothetical protein